MTINPFQNNAPPIELGTPLPLDIDQGFLKKSPLKFTATSIALFIFVGFLWFTADNTLSRWGFGILFIFLLLNKLRAWHPKQQRQLNFIQTTRIPPQIWQNDTLRALNLTPYQKKLIEAGLKDFFLLHALYPKKPLAMPSQMVDKLWHAFILDTQRYEAYCKQAFGKLFHHIPDYQFTDHQRNIQMFTWQGACRLQGQPPAQPLTIPRLFAIDGVIWGTMAVGSVMWESYQQQMAMQYQQWHAQTYSDGGSGGWDSDNSKSNCDVGITSDGDCSCGGGGDGGGGGCGG